MTSAQDSSGNINLALNSSAFADGKSKHELDLVMPFTIKQATLGGDYLINVDDKTLYFGKQSNSNETVQVQNGTYDATLPRISSVSTPATDVLGATYNSTSERIALSLSGDFSTDIAINNFKKPFLRGTAVIASNGNSTLTLNPAGEVSFSSIDTSFTPPSGSVSVTATSSGISANYANSAIVGLSASGIDRQTDLNSNGTTSFRITPSSDSVDVSITAWNISSDYHKSWTETSATHGVTAAHVIGNLESNTYYTLEVDSALYGTYLSNSSGQISFTYSGGYSAHTFEITEDTGVPSSFNLVSPANAAVISDRNPTFAWHASSDTGSGLLKYQLYLDGAMDKDNISNSATSTLSGATLSCGNHSWYVKAIDNNSNATSSDTFHLEINCSGGFFSPTKPDTSATTVTLSPDGELNLNNLPAAITQISISLTSDFSGTSWEDVSKAEELLKKYTNTDKLYLRFRTKDGAISDIVIYNKVAVSSPVATSSYPTGTLLKLPDSFRVYVVIDGKKKWISTPEVFEQLGYKWTNITTVTEVQLDTLTDFEDNLIRAIGGYKVYLVVNGVKRHIPNPAIFLDYGFKWDEVKDVPQSTIDRYKSTYLIKQSGSNGIYYVSPQEIRKLIPTTEVFNSYNDKMEDVQIISKTEMDSYPVSNLIKLNGSNDIYLIEGNIKRHIPSVTIFNKYKLNWNLVMSVNQTEFNFYQDGGELK
jgi:hypothetical protein